MLILQKFGFKESAYQRPQDKWVCGRLAEGNPCSAGPGADGCCRATSACQPFHEDDRWHCRRGQSDGGPCETGPLPDGQCCQKSPPCNPVLSLRSKRKRAAIWAVSLCVGVITLMVGGDRAAEFLMPGPLSAPHASQSDCQSCHADVTPDNLGWLHALVKTADPAENAKLCTNCHSVGEFALAPHTYPVEQLKKLTARYAAADNAVEIKNESLLHKIALPLPENDPETGQSKIYCATCHQEHQGALHDQKTVSDNRCQSCHTSKFGAFATSHAEFSNYPYNRRTRIIFDHKSHIGKHFPKTVETATPGQAIPSACGDCHTTGVGNKYMENKGYEPMCSSCHEGDILGTTRASGPKGIDFLAVPGLDIATLNERGIDIGQWPEDSEAELTVFLKAILATEPKGAGIVRNVADLDLLDLSEAGEADLANVKALAWSVKALLRRLESVQLSKAITQLPKNADGSDIDHEQLARLSGLMSHDVIISGNKEWFPELSDDLGQFGIGESTASFALLNAEQDAQRNEDASQAPSANDPAIENAGADDGLELEDDGSDSLEDSLESPDADLEGEADLEIATDDALDTSNELDEGPGLLEEDNSGDALAGEQDGELESGLEETDALAADSGEDILGSDDSDSLELGEAADDDGLGGDTDSSLETDTAETGDEAEETAEPFDPETWAEFGGWYRQDFTIRYRPSGHSDRFLRTWMDFSSHALGKEQKALLTPLFERLIAKGAQGRCGKCHSVDDEDGYKLVKWRGFNTGRVKNRFTTFSHEPHLNASGSKGCLLCHELGTDKANYLKTYEGGAVDMFVPNFKPLDKATCSSCHTSKSAGESCTLCHDYHATELGETRTITKLP